MLHPWADMLKGLLDHVGIPSAYLVGVVNGLLFTRHFATRHRERVRGLALVAAPTDDTQWWQAVVDATCLEPARIIEDQGMAAALQAGGGRTPTPAMWAGGLTNQQLSRPDVPAIVCSGPGGSMDAYPVHSPEDARRLHQALSNSQLVISSRHLGTQWPTVLDQLAEASFDPLVVAVSGSVTTS